MGVEEDSESTLELDEPKSTNPSLPNGDAKQISDDVENLIGVARSLGAISLDISKKGLQYIPAAILELDHVEVLSILKDTINRAFRVPEISLGNIVWHLVF